MEALRGQVALFAIAVLSLAALSYLYILAGSRVRLVYHGEAEWMILLATARHSLATGEDLGALMARLEEAASENGVWVPPVRWEVYRGRNGTGWSYRAVFYNYTLRGFEGWFYASARYRLVGAERDLDDNLWLVYSLEYVHRYKLPQYSYPITLRPEPLNTSCARAYEAGGGLWTIKITPNCILTDKWNITIIKV